MTLIRLVSPLLLISLFGCTTHTLIKTVELPIFPEPRLTPVAPADVQCLSAKAYSDIVNRESLLRKWGQQNFNVIEVNNKKATQR